MDAQPFAHAAGDLAPLLHWRAWAGGLGVVGIAWLLGACLTPRLRGRPTGDAWLLRVMLGLAPAALAVLLLGQFDGLLLVFPWAWAALAGWAFMIVTVLWRWRQHTKNQPQSA